MTKPGSTLAAYFAIRSGLPVSMAIQPSQTSPAKKVKIPEGLWVKCDNCKEIIYRKEVEKNYKVCPKCDYHFRITASERLPFLVDENSFLEVEDGLSPKDALGFKDYKE